jgi:hypothetical protein
MEVHLTPDAEAFLARGEGHMITTHEENGLTGREHQAPGRRVVTLLMPGLLVRIPSMACSNVTNQQRRDEAGRWEHTSMRNRFAQELFDFVTRVADDDWGLSHQQLVVEARALLGRTYSPDEDSDG